MYNIKNLFLLLTLTNFSFNVSSQEDNLKPYIDSIQTNELLGHLLSQQDWAAEVGTDAIIRLGADLTNKKLKAFIVEKLENSWLLSFIGKRKFSNGIYYQIEVSLKGPIDTSYKNHEKPINLTKYQKSLFKATQLAKKQEIMKCSSSYNNSAIPLIREDGTTHFYVYMLAATNDSTINIGGGHHRFLIDPNKNNIVEHFQHTNTCLNSTSNKDATSLVFTHFTSDVPNEFHIYMSYLNELPIYVLTMENKIIWKVFEGKIILIENPNEGNNKSIQDRMKNIIKKNKK